MNLTEVLTVRPNKTLYRDGNMIIKLFNEDCSASDVLNEALNHAVVMETGVRVPHIEEVAKVDGKWAIVMEYVEGKTLARIIEEEPDNQNAHFERFVDAQLAMHTYTAERLRHHTDKMRAKIDKCGLDATARYELHMRLNGLPRHNKLCHGDFTPGNIIITPQDEVCIIDWAHATQGNASADAARTYLRFALAGNRGQGNAYLDLFCKKSDTARQYVEKWMAIVAASQLVKRKPEETEILTEWANVIEYE